MVYKLKNGYSLANMLEEIKRSFRLGSTLLNNRAEQWLRQAQPPFSTLATTQSRTVAAWRLNGGFDKLSHRLKGGKQ